MIKTKLFFILVLFSSLFFAGCPTSPDDSSPSAAKAEENPAVTGDWKSSFNEVFSIKKDETPPMFYNYFGAALCYKGEIVAHDSWDSSEGYITIKYTYNKYVAGVENKYYRLHWKSLKKGSCSFSGAYKAGGQSAMNTAGEAASEFTKEKGYFGSYSDTVKQ